VSPEVSQQVTRPHRFSKKTIRVRTGVVADSQEPNAGAERKRLDEATMLSFLELILKWNEDSAKKISETPK